MTPRTECRDLAHRRNMIDTEAIEIAAHQICRHLTMRRRWLMICPPLASFTCRDDYTGLERLALAMKPSGFLAGAASIEASSGTFPSLCKLEPALMPSSGAFPPRWVTSGVGTRGRLGLRLSRAHTSFKMQCIATVMDDVSEGGRRDAGRATRSSLTGRGA
jgi:hypothetical protein